jgi:hypothetical protein
LDPGRVQRRRYLHLDLLGQQRRLELRLQHDLAIPIKKDY